MQSCSEDVGKELARKVRAAARRFRRWIQRDLLGLTGASDSGWIDRVADRQVAIGLAADKVSKGRVAVLVLGLAPERSSSSVIEWDGFVASARKCEKIVDKPRIMARLRRRAFGSAVELLEGIPSNQPRGGLDTLAAQAWSSGVTK